MPRVAPFGNLSMWGPATDIKPFITGRIALEDLMEQGYDTLIKHKDTAVKALVHP